MCGRSCFMSSAFMLDLLFITAVNRTNLFLQPIVLISLHFAGFYFCFFDHCLCTLAQSHVRKLLHFLFHSLKVVLHKHIDLHEQTGIHTPAYAPTQRLLFPSLPFPSLPFLVLLSSHTLNCPTRILTHSALYFIQCPLPTTAAAL